MTQPAQRRGVIASEALDAFFADLDHLGWEDRGRISFPADDPARVEARAIAQAAAARAGRAGELETAVDAARAWVDGAYAARLYQPTWVALNWGRSTGSLEDRVTMTAIVEDAVSAVVVDGLVAATVGETLREPFELVRSMHPGQLSTPAEARRRRWGRPAAVVLLVVALTVFFADSVSWVGPVGLAIPLAMAVLIFVRLTSLPPRP